MCPVACRRHNAVTAVTAVNIKTNEAMHTPASRSAPLAAMCLYIDGIPCATSTKSAGNLLSRDGAACASVAADKISQAANFISGTAGLFIRHGDRLYGDISDAALYATIKREHRSVK